MVKGPETIDAEGIQIPSFRKDCTVGAQCFENMPNLRYLQAEYVNFHGTFPCFPTDLKWLQLKSCHFDSPPSDFNLEKLVILHLHKTNMAPILRLKAFERLKVLSLSEVETKITLDFTNMPSLVKLQFLYCSALATIDESIGKLKNLTHLSTPDCRLLRKLPDSIWRLSSLEVLNISSCWEFSSLPKRLGELGSLKKLDLSFTHIKKVPASIGQLTDLHELSLCGSEKLRELPESICQLKLLKSLDLTGCLSLCSLPERLGDMEKLEELILDSTRIEAIPDSVGRLDNLRLLSLKGCKFIKALPISIGQLSSIQRLDLSGTNLNVAEIDLAAINFIEFTALPDFIGRLENLETFSFHSKKLKYLDAAIFESLGRLRSLHLKACENLEGLLAASIGQTDFARLSSLDSLDLEDSKGLEYLPQLPSSLSFLDASGCTNLRKMWDISNLKNLRSLCLDGCKQLEDVPGLEYISSNLGTLGLPGPCDFMGCCHFSHDFKNKVFMDMSFENLQWLNISGSLVPGSAKGQQKLQFKLLKLPFIWLGRAQLMLVLHKVLSPMCKAIIADDVTVFEKTVEVKDGHFVRLNLGAENIVNTGEGAHCYTMQMSRCPQKPGA
ncbi:Disease resistance-like protein [Nymphaea thermarum]|nr:Disease resistance-like protein [Nymphaea thermarum]